MVCHKEIFSMRIYIVFVLLSASAYYSHAQTNDKIKSMIINQIMKKISNISMNALSKAPADRKELILNKIENKLRNSAVLMGPDGNKYVKFIMDEFKTKTFNEPAKTHDEPKKNFEVPNNFDEPEKIFDTPLNAFDKPENTFDAPQNISDPFEVRKSIEGKNMKYNKKRAGRSQIDHEIIHQSGTNHNHNKKPVHTEMDPETKEEIIKDISNKIQYLAKGFIKSANTDGEKREILEKIKQKILESAKEKHKQIHAKHDELKIYSNLIAQGIEVSMHALLEQDPALDDYRRREKDKLRGKHEKGEITIKNNNEMKKEENAVLNNPPLSGDEISLNVTTRAPRCDEIVDETCLKIKSFTRIPCGDGKTIHIENLCNGVIDCINQVDEINCTLQAMGKIREASTVMLDIDTSIKRKCFKDSNVLTTQHRTLKDVLQTQMEFLKKQLTVPPLYTETIDDMLKKAVTDVGSILSTLSYALDKSLCSHDMEVEGVKKQPISYLKFSPKSCNCKNGFCVHPDCESPCKRVCWQKHILNHWSCTTINGGLSVSLNAICDGKIDCFDESDESLCTTDPNRAKFEASTLYSNVLDFIESKTRSLEFANSRSKMGTLHGYVRQLQKHTMKTNIDDHIIQTLRDDAFKILVTIFEDYLQSPDVNLFELDQLYMHLLSINDKLVNALKRSHTGNENLISPEGCFCRGGLCALRRCNKNCIQACLAEPILTKFSCGSSKTTVPIQTICNGKNNCPNGEDEKDCKKEACRGHHLVVLRHNLENVGAKHRNTVLGEILETWKNKVTAVLLIAEKAERPYKHTMLDVVSRILHDLVVAFAAMEDYRKSNSAFALQEFKQVSNIVMKTLKACGN